MIESITGQSEQINAIKQLIKKVAPTPANVLITGETGTGKEITANCLHHLSDRKDKPFIAINCGAIPCELLESELFGHEKGAFTGALSARAGKFELAQGGTLFLDEIGEMPLLMQVKLLRVIQERMVERIGSHKPIRADVRIIAATNKNLLQEIPLGRFRADLYYRLNVFPIALPSLRERIQDLPLLAASLLAQLESKYASRIHLSCETLACLQQQAWIGNIRELANLLERLIILYPGQTIEPAQVSI